MIEFHPHAGGLVSVSRDHTIDIYSLENLSPAISLESKDPSKSHYWSPISGTTLLSHSATNIVSIYDPRASTSPQSEIQTNFQTTRPSHSTFLDDNTLIITGISPTKSRNLHLYDLRSPLTPKSTIPFDPASSPSISLFPLVDSTRKLLYLLQTHSSSLFAFDFNSPNPVPTTLQIPSTIVAGTLLPARNVDVMRGEINRVFVLTRKDEIVPVSVRIERKVCSCLEWGLIVELYGFSWRFIS
jgi:WD40 repeat protein